VWCPTYYTETFWNYINNNLPNLDFLGGLMISLRKIFNDLINTIKREIYYTQTQDEKIDKFKEILTSIFNQ
jgi:hypothetical protein